MAFEWLHSRAAALSVVLAALSLGACDNSIDPFSESTRYYAIFGFLDADRDSQFVRIEPTRSNREAGPVEYDVESVITTDLTSGEIVVWRDSLVELEEGGVGLVYYASFRPQRGGRYRIEVARSDGATTSAETTIPDMPALSVRRPNRSFLGSLEQGLLFDRVVRRPEQVVVNYAVTFGTRTDPLDVKLVYNPPGVPEGDGWRIIVRLTRDKATVFQRLSLTANDGVALHTLSIDLRLLSDDWPLTDPGLTETNVTNGFGFFGSAATHHASWVLDSLFVAELGFINRQDALGNAQ
ncbi:MAG TPA: DUF4249 family protein [Rhodothermales bacterium]|nr:DUF4249 family protein [Rhodothermales bacterium]